jgi:hypothetical protein
MMMFHTVSAQDAKHFSLGIELASTTGVGLELATSLNPHFALRGGISMFPFAYHVDPVKIPMEDKLKNRMTTAMSNPVTSAALLQAGLPTRFEDVNRDMDITASLGLVNAKLLIDFYPSKKSSFHLTGGLYIGKEKLLNVEGKMEQMTQILGVIEKNGTNLWSDIYANTDEYQLMAKDLTDINAALAIATVKPYLGLGFGRAVPKRRVGVSFDIGAFYMGAPKAKSDNVNVQKMVEYELKDVSDLLKYLSWYPTMSLKINIKIL